MFGRPGSSRVKARGRAEPGPRGGVLFVLLLAGLVALVFLGRIYLERQTMQQGLAWESRHRQLSITQKEKENLELERAALTQGDHILTQSRALGLGPALPGQVRRMKEPPPPEAIVGGPPQLAQRGSQP